ncbi:alpha/beta hydrolase [Catenovulum sp. SM1970]|uniref:alpha/beta fold hydrolase n=1 Tax=Marinifaba aquimaris TaxID=2741323 RepID=UPI0015729BC3|nr:alpha/beta hydrolase [Marinifaba aquimaris]NTS78442.1 alpha/beta hydrolase [Marinifaba aquimaris]
MKDNDKVELPQGVNQCYIDIKGLTISYWQYCHANKTKKRATKPWVVLHGWLDNNASYVPLIEQLNQLDSFENDIYFIEFAGHGLSQHKSEDSHYHFIDWVYELSELLEVLVLNPCHLIGHSLGGIVGSVYSGLYPEKVTSLTMLDAAGPYTSEVDVTEQIRQAFDSRKAISNSQTKHYSSLDAIIRARAFHSQIPEHLASLLIKRAMTGNDATGWSWASDSKLKTLSPVRLTDVQAHQIIEKITCPINVILASEGEPTIRKAFEHRQYKFKNMQYAVIEGSHHVHMEKPEQVLARIMKFHSQLNHNQ